MAGSDMPVTLGEVRDFLMGLDPERELSCTLDQIWIHEEASDDPWVYSASVTLGASPSTVGVSLGWVRWAIYEVASEGARVYVDAGREGRSPLSLERLESLLVSAGGV